MLLHFSTKIEFYCFKWTFVCASIDSGDARLMYLREFFTRPVLVIANEFSQQIDELQAIIAQKGVLLITILTF